MNLKYQIIRDVNVSPDVLIGRLTNALSADGYIVQKITDEVILFDEDKRTVRSRWKVFSRFEKGKIELKKNSDNLMMLKFEYYVSIKLLIVVTARLFIISIMEMRPIILFIAPVFIELLARIQTLKATSTRIIDSVMAD